MTRNERRWVSWGVFVWTLALLSIVSQMRKLGADPVSFVNIFGDTVLIEDIRARGER
jgi:hypothetical protein